MKINRYIAYVPQTPKRRFSGAFLVLLLAFWLANSGPATAQTAIGSSAPQTTETAVPAQLSPAAYQNPAIQTSAHQVAIDGDKRVLQAIWQSVWGPPLSARVRQSVSQFDRQLVGVGQYWQAGNGSGQLKFLLRIAAGGNINSLLQVSDGRLLWTSHEVASARLSRVDLGRVREYLHPGPWKDSQSPELALYLAIGGQSEMLRGLYHQYQWTKVVESMHGEIPVFIVHGQRRSEPAAIAAAASADHLLPAGDAKGLVPTTAKLTLGRETTMPLFPYRIEYITPDDAESDGLHQGLNSTIEFFDVMTPIAITPELFNYQVKDDVDQIADDTPRYLPPAPLELSRSTTPEVNR